MFNSNQRLMNRWRLDHKLSDLDRIERWVVWDLQTEEQVELLTPTPAEKIHVQQPQFFMDVHQNNPDCRHCGLEDTQAFAIYPFGISEFVPSKPIRVDQLHDFIHSVHTLLDVHGDRLYPTEIVVYDDGIKLRPLGQTPKTSTILVNPLHHPTEPNKVFSLAMMIVLSHHPNTHWKDQQSFQKWIENFQAKAWIPNCSLEIQQWIQAAIQSHPLPSLNAHTGTVTLEPILFEPPSSTQAVQQSLTVSHAVRDVPMPKHLIVAHSIPSPSIAKQIAALSGIPLDIVLDAFENETLLVVDGGDTIETAEKELKRYTNIPITFVIHDKQGLLGHTGVKLGLSGSLVGGILLTSLGLGWIPLGIGAGIWALGKTFQSRQQNQYAEMWKNAQRIGVQDDNPTSKALQAARKRVLSSDLPSLALADLIKQIDALEENSIHSPQQTVDLANQIHVESGNIDTALKKSIQKTEDLVKSSIQ